MAEKLTQGAGAAAQTPPLPVTLDREAFIRFLTDASAAAQKVADANNVNMQTWKRTDALNIHRQAAKDILRLSKMDASKRDDYFRAFDRYREMASLDARQADMLDADMDHPEILSSARNDGAAAFTRQVPLASNPGGTPARAAAWESGWKEAAALAKHQKVKDGVTTPAPAAEPEEVFTESKDDLDGDQDRNFGDDEAYGAGKRAGLAGKSMSTNPNSVGRAAYAAFNSGWMKGQEELAAQITKNGSGRQGRQAKADAHA